MLENHISFYSVFHRGISPKRRGAKPDTNQKQLNSALKAFGKNQPQ